MCFPFPPVVLRASRSQVESGSWLVDEHGEQGLLSFPASLTDDGNDNYTSKTPIPPLRMKSPTLSEQSELSGGFESSLLAHKYLLSQMLSPGNSIEWLRSPWEEQDSFDSKRRKSWGQGRANCRETSGQFCFCR